MINLRLIKIADKTQCIIYLFFDFISKERYILTINFLVQDKSKMMHTNNSCKEGSLYLYHYQLTCNESILFVKIWLGNLDQEHIVSLLYLQ